MVSLKKSLGRRVVTSMAAFAMVISISGCNDAGSSDVASLSERAKTMAPDDVFDEGVRLSDIPYSPDEVRDLGHEVCDKLDDFDGDLEAFSAAAVATGSAGDNAEEQKWFGKVLAIAVTAYCPEHQP